MNAQANVSHKASITEIKLRFKDSFFSTKTSLELFRQDGSNDGSQNMFLRRNMASYPYIIPVTPSYLEHYYTEQYIFNMLFSFGYKTEDFPFLSNFQNFKKKKKKKCKIRLQETGLDFSY